MQPHHFLPDYVDLHPSEILNSFTSFNDFIYTTKELSDLALDRIENVVPENEFAFKHQKIIARFLSSNALYDEIFLFHSPGTGKTCSAIHTIETVIQNPSIHINSALILVKNDDLLDQFRTSIMDTCTGNKYDRNTMKKSYILNTFEKFYNMYKDQVQVIKTKFSNTVIVIDEVHNLTTTKMYPFYLEFLHSLSNRKIIIMTGTPMTNSYTDIFPIMNLILPTDLQVSTMTSEEDLIRAFIGRISYLKLNSGIDVQFQGTQVAGVYYPLVFSSVSPFQFEFYSKIPTGEAFHGAQIDASLFVYPDGSSGGKGFGKWVIKSQHRVTNKIEYNARFLNELKSPRLSIDDRLNKIGVYSSKYKRIIMDILEHPSEKIFVYESSIRGSGAVILGLCLEIFGFSRATTNSNSKGRRYVILSQDTNTDWSDIRQTFNSPQNDTGNLIQVLIGGEKVKEGVTFKHIKRIHIPRAPWHYADLDQIMARGARLGAHGKYPQPIRVFLHVMDIRGYNFDLSTYHAAQRKDDKIKRIEYIIKTNAFDCPLTFKRNYSPTTKNNSRECEYNDCLYRCAIKQPPDTQIRTDNYMNYYLDPYSKVDEIQLLLGELHQFTLDVSDVILVKAVQELISVRYKFYDKYYLQESNGVVFLTNELRPVSGVFPKNVPRLNIQAIPESIDMSDIFDEKDFTLQKNRLINKPFHIQEFFIEEAILNQTNRTPLIRWILDYYKQYIHLQNKTSTFLPDKVRKYEGFEWKTLKVKANHVIKMGRIDVPQEEQYNDLFTIKIGKVTHIDINKDMKLNTRTVLTILADVLDIQAVYKYGKSQLAELVQEKIVFL